MMGGHIIIQYTFACNNFPLSGWCYFTYVGFVYVKNYSLNSHFIPICLSCLKCQTFSGNIIYYVVYFIKMYKFTKLLLNKFISFFFLRIILSEAIKKVSQLD